MKHHNDHTRDDRCTAVAGYPFFVADPLAFKRRLLAWADQYPIACFLDHNDYPHARHRSFDCLAGVGGDPEALVFPGMAADPFDALHAFHASSPTWLFGFLAYDLKNRLERLHSIHPDGIRFPELYFFRPEITLQLRGHEVCIEAGGKDPGSVFSEINRMKTPFDETSPLQPPCAIQSRFNRSEYIAAVEAIRAHIREGDVYEMNFCQEFFAEAAIRQPAQLFDRLNREAASPFSAYFKYRQRYLLCASPERFLKKEGDRLISQPIKGTAPRGIDVSDDARWREALRNSSKDRAEHIMIVDLVRNDLARSCEPGSVQVEECFGLYAFPQVWQMISTVQGQLRKEVSWTEAIRNAFPMGSMTGAPKVRAMELIETFERTRRGLYSGAVGYISPEGDFDFNVVIRSLLLNAADRYLSFQAGGAIVYDSDPEAEYAECLLKSQLIRRLLSS